jgi:hypothetical protein
MPDPATTPAARLAARSRRLRTAGIAGALAMLAAFSGLAAGRMAGGDDAAAGTAATVTTPAASSASPSTGAEQAQDGYFGGSQDGSVSPAAPSQAPDASSGAS